MARPLRIVIEDGWYHVINRGIERRSIFRSAADSGRFLQLLAQLPTRFGLLVHCYALMPNHYHLLVQTPQANLSQAVQWLNVSYSVWFNRKHHRFMTTA
jgi:putative transposase